MRMVTPSVLLGEVHCQARGGLLQSCSYQPLKRCRQRSSSASIVMGDSVDLECFLLGSGGADSSVGTGRALCLVCRGGAGCCFLLSGHDWTGGVFPCFFVSVPDFKWAGGVLVLHFAGTVLPVWFCFLVRGDKRAAMVASQRVGDMCGDCDGHVGGSSALRSARGPACPDSRRRYRLQCLVCCCFESPCSVPILRRWILLLRALPSLPLLLPSSLSLARPALKLDGDLLAVIHRLVETGKLGTVKGTAVMGHAAGLVF